MRLSNCARGARREPNTRATTIELFDGLEAPRAKIAGHRFASISLSVNSLLAPLLPGRLLLQDLHVAGVVLGARLRAADPPCRRLGPRRRRTRSRSLRAGFRFLRRADYRLRRRRIWRPRSTAARSGARVILCEQDFVFGRTPAGGRPRDRRRALAAFGRTASSPNSAACRNVRLMPRTCVFGVYDGARLRRL